MEWENIAPVQTGKVLTEEQVADELTQALRYINFSQCTQADIYVNQATPKEDEYQKYQPFLGWKPLEVIKRTFDATTQFAAVCFSPPLRRHYKSRFPTFNKPRLREMFCTDTWFGSTQLLVDILVLNFIMESSPSLLHSTLWLLSPKALNPLKTSVGIGEPRSS